MVIAAFNRKKFGARSNAFSQVLSMGDRHRSIVGAVNQEHGFIHAMRKRERVGSPMMFFLERTEARFQYGFRLRIVGIELLRLGEIGQHHRAVNDWESSHSRRRLGAGAHLNVVVTRRPASSLR